jgi:hypothetical protein
MAIEQYLNDITSQHRDKPKFIGWLSANLNILDDIYNCLDSFTTAFDIDKAIGIQQDIIGKSIGSNRILDVQPVGMSPVLDDGTYRLLQKAKIAQNNWDSTVPQIYELWNNMFDDLGLQVIDNQDMSMTAVVTGYVNQENQALIANNYIVPKPSGVSINYIGLSPVTFMPYEGMLVGYNQISTINMSYNPIETINFNQYTGMLVQQLSTVTLNVEEVIKWLYSVICQ